MQGVETVDRERTLFSSLRELRTRHRQRLSELTQLRAQAQDREEVWVIEDLQRSVENRLSEIDKHLRPDTEGNAAERARSRSESPWQKHVKFHSSSEDEGESSGKKKPAEELAVRKAAEEPGERDADARVRRRSRDRGPGRRDRRSRSGRGGRRPRSRSAVPRPRKNGFTDGATYAMKKVAANELLPTYPTEISTGSVPGRFGKTHLYLSHVQVRCLIGRSGCNIQKIMKETMAQIHINSPTQASTADVSIAGNIEPAMKMIRELLEHHGCPISDKAGAPDANAPGLLSVPSCFMGALIGPKAGLVLDLQRTYGKEIFVQKLGYIAADGGEIVQVVGTRWKEAKVAIEEWLERKKANAKLAAASTSASSAANA